MSATPMSVFLPFNREVLGPAFEPAKSASSPPPQVCSKAALDLRERT